MTVEGFLKALDEAEQRASAFKRQQEVNLDYALAYESALRTIAKLCGHEFKTEFPTAKSFPVDIDGIAIRAVNNLLEKFHAFGNNKCGTCMFWGMGGKEMNAKQPVFEMCGWIGAQLQTKNLLLTRKSFGCLHHTARPSDEKPAPAR